MNRPALFLTLVAVGASLGWAKEQSATTIEAFNRGVKQFNAQHYEDALPYFNEAVSQDAEFAEAYYARAACRHALHQNENALADLNEALRANPEYLDAFSLRGAVLYELENWDGAYADFSRVLKKRPRDAQALLGHGVVALKKNELGVAQHDLSLFLKLHPDDPIAPRLRKVLASLKEDSQSETASEPDESPTQEAAAKPSKPKRVVSERTRDLSEDLFMGSHPVSEDYGNKILRGERGEAVGDLNNEGVHIVEPNK
jgi:tetratricopeptide (TPR) repeat protein